MMMISRITQGHFLYHISDHLVLKNALIDPVTLTFDLSTPKLCHFQDIRRSLPIPCLNSLKSFVFELCSGQTNRQTYRSFYPHNKWQGTTRLRPVGVSDVIMKTKSGQSRYVQYTPDCILRGILTELSMCYSILQHFSNAHCTIIMNSSFRLVYWIGL